MSETHVTWAAPAPLWAAPDLAAAGGEAFLRPELLRFESDSFMEQLVQLLEHDPARLAELRALPETWRAPARAVVAPPEQPAFARPLLRQRRIAARSQAPARPALPAPDPALPLKLYQPAHGRFYLVSACLVCRMPGLPDRALNLGAQERVGFVVRMLRPRDGDPEATRIDLDDCDEFAFIGQGDAATWQRLTGDRRTFVPGEERHPLFGLSFVADDGRRRRLLAGLAPVGQRERYMGARERAAAAEDDPGAESPDPRDALLLSDVIEPWKQLIYRIELRGRQIAAPPPSGLSTSGSQDRAPQYQAAREQAQVISWYLLLDLADFLRRYLPAVMDEVESGGSSLPLTRALDAITLPPALRAALVDPAGGTAYTSDELWGSLRAALAGIGGYRAGLDRVTAPYNRRSPPTGWPDRLFPLADPQHEGPLWGTGDDSAAPVETLREQIVGALAPLDQLAGVAPPLPLVAQRAVAPQTPAWFAVRCVFERPGCGPLAPPLVSPLSEPFQIAAFFDPDAPARPIRIAMPVDVSPGGLRKFAKNTAFVMSDMLQCQVEKLGGLSLGDLVRSVLPWPLHKDLPADQGACADGGPSFGMICSLSIPIITICALILLMIIVSLLDIIFRWIPFFILCLPLPGFKARPRPPT